LDVYKLGKHKIMFIFLTVFTIGKHFLLNYGIQQHYFY